MRAGVSRGGVLVHLFVTFILSRDVNAKAETTQDDMERQGKRTHFNTTGYLVYIHSLILQYFKFISYLMLHLLQFLNLS